MASRSTLIRHISGLLIAASLLPGAVWAQAVQLGFFNVDSDDASRRPVARHVARYPQIGLWGFTQVWDARWESELRSSFAKARGSEAGSVLGVSGGANRNLLIYDTAQFSLLGSGDIPGIEPRVDAAAPLFGHFRHKDGQEFLVVVVQMDRASAANRKAASSALANWAAGQSLPVVVGGSFNLGVDPGVGQGAPELSSLAPLAWARLDPSMATACAPYDAIQDFVFLGPGAAQWLDRSWVLSPEPAYCPDSELTSSHRPIAVMLQLSPPAPQAPEAPQPPEAVSIPAAEEATAPQPDQMMRKIEGMEAEIQALKQQLEQVKSQASED